MKTTTIFKTLATTSLGVLCAVLPMGASAATLSATPLDVSVTAGQTVTLTLSADAEGTQAVTVKAQVAYPETLLTPVSFTFAPSWVALAQAGYDQMDDGLVIKTAGYQGGFTGVQTVGTVVFRAIGSGTGTLSLTGSQMWNTAGEQSLSVQAVPRVTIAPAAAQTSTATANTSTAEGGADATAGASTESQTPATTTATSDEDVSGVDTGNQTAAAGATSFADSIAQNWLMILASALFVGIAGGASWFLYKRKNQ